ncbi:MAG: hypothetical protein ACTHKR_05780 [Sphingomonas sp.]
MASRREKRSNGATRRTAGDHAPTEGGRPQEKVEDRPSVGQIEPEDYPPDQRAKG